MSLQRRQRWNPLSGKFDLATDAPPGFSVPVVKSSETDLAAGITSKTHGGTVKPNNIAFLRADLTTAMALANDIKLQYNSHLADGGIAPAVHKAIDGVHTITSPDATDFTSLVTLITEMLTDYTAHLADAILGAGWTYHIAQGTNWALTSTVAPVTFADCVARLNDLSGKYKSHDFEAVEHRIGGSYPTVAPDAELLWTEDTTYVWIQNSGTPNTIVDITSATADHVLITYYWE